MPLLIHQARYDLLGLWRNPRTRVFTVVLPLVLLVALIGTAGGRTTVDGDPIALKRFLVGGIIAMALMASAYGGTLASVVGRRESGVLKRRRATPVPAWVIVAGQALTVLLVALASTALLLVVARIFYGIGLTGTGLAEVALAVVLGGLVFACLGYALSGLVPNAEAAQPAVQVTMLPLYFISGLWFSVDSLPDAVRTLGRALPVEPVVDLLHRATLHPSVPAHDLLVLGAWTAGALALAARRFSWLPR